MKKDHWDEVSIPDEPGLSIEEGPGGDDPLLQGLLLLCSLHGRQASAGELTAGLPLEGGRMTLGLLPRAARRADLDVRVRRRKPGSIGAELLPAMLIGDDGRPVVLLRAEAGRYTAVFPDMPSREFTLDRQRLGLDEPCVAVLAAPFARRDDRVGAYAADPDRHWFWGEVRRQRRHFLEVAFAAALANMLALSTALFARQVFDRVLPNFAFETLWVLTIGIGIAILVELAVRIVRSHLMDATGRELDLRLSARIFEQAVSLTMEAKPKSTGSFASQIREFDAVREFFTSTTIGALSDLPFVVLFVFVIWLIGGPVALVLVAAIPLIVIPGLIAQWPLSRLSRQHLREGAIRNGLLMEAVSGAETVKAVQAESRFQRLWEEYSALLAAKGMKIRALSGTLTYMATTVQHLSYVFVTVVGVYLVAAGEMSVGGLLACSILSSRTIAPLTQLAGIFARWQQMRAALAGLDSIMAMPVDRPAGRKFVQRPRLGGAYRFEEVTFSYDQDSDPAIRIPTFSLEPGSATAVLGTNGSGKSTLLKLLAGLYHPAAGQLTLDGTDIRQIDPADLRRNAAYLPQDVRLFYGTLRDNLRLGVEDRDDDDLLEALKFVGAQSLVQEHQLGLDRMIGEGGSGISGGQRQSIGLARIWLRDPRVVLLDEPTASLDHALELRLIARLRQWAKGRTLVIATHRQPVMGIVERAVVLTGGRPVADGPVEGVLASLAANRPQTPDAATAESREGAVR